MNTIEAMQLQTSSFLESHVELEAIQTVSPTKVITPRSTTRVEAKGVATSSFLERRVHVVLYHEGVSDRDSGYVLAGWFRDSLGRAMEEEPILAGRVRRGGDKDGVFEIVSNDAGVRLVEARIGKTLAEFVGAEEKDGMEDSLVSWEDVGGDGNPQFCPVLHVQVTNFLCGGYSVGISCSLLVADPFFIVGFLRRWSNIHQKMVYEANYRKSPLFYLSNFKPPNSAFVRQISSDTFKDRGKTSIFKTSFMKTLDDSEMNKTLALECINEAELKHGVKKLYSFDLFVKGVDGDVKVEKLEREWLMEKPLFELSCVNWDDLGAKEVTFNEGNKVVCASNWINSISGEGLVILFPVSNGIFLEISIIVTLPKETELTRFETS